MKVQLETDRLLLRDFEMDDDRNIFELDSDPEVHRFLGAKPLTTLQQAQEVIRSVRQQYIDNGIGRWAVINKQNGLFIGWAGLKYMREVTNGQVLFYDLGYRFKKDHWGKGYATEAAKALVDHGFQKMKLQDVFAMADAGNAASRRVLEKTGLVHQGQFIYEEVLHDWFKISKQNC